MEIFLLNVLGSAAVAAVVVVGAMSNRLSKELAGSAYGRLDSRQEQQVRTFFRLRP